MIEKLFFSGTKNRKQTKNPMKMTLNVYLLRSLMNVGADGTQIKTDDDLLDVK